MPKKVLVGKVVSNKMDKTAVVAVELRVPHTKYEKQIVETRKFKAHDAENKCQAGRHQKEHHPELQAVEELLTEEQ